MRMPRKLVLMAAASLTALTPAVVDVLGSPTIAGAYSSSMRRLPCTWCRSVAQACIRPASSGSSA